MRSLFTYFSRSHLGAKEERGKLDFVTFILLFFFFTKKSLINNENRNYVDIKYLYSHVSCRYTHI